MSSLTTSRVNAVRQLSAAKLNVMGLVLTAAGMLLQIAAGSTQYPGFAGPIVLLTAAAIVAFWPGRWTPWVGFVVPLVLGVGATIAAIMTGEFVNQLTDLGHVGILVGSVMHVIGLTAALSGGVGMLKAQLDTAGRER